MYVCIYQSIYLSIYVSIYLSAVGQVAAWCSPVESGCGTMMPPVRACVCVLCVCKTHAPTHTFTHTHTHRIYAMYISICILHAYTYCMHANPNNQYRSERREALEVHLGARYLHAPGGVILLKFVTDASLLKFTTDASGRVGGLRHSQVPGVCWGERRSR